MADGRLRRQLELGATSWQFKLAVEVEVSLLLRIHSRILASIRGFLGVSSAWMIFMPENGVFGPVAAEKIIRRCDSKKCGIGLVSELSVHWQAPTKRLPEYLLGCARLAAATQANQNQKPIP